MVSVGFAGAVADSAKARNHIGEKESPQAAIFSEGM